jgi:hypothetical protein
MSRCDNVGRRQASGGPSSQADRQPVAGSADNRAQGPARSSPCLPSDASAAPRATIGSFKKKVDQEEWAHRARNDFERLFYSHLGHGLHKWHHYLEIYDRHLSWFLAARRRRGETGPVRLLEIGVAAGGSLQMWRKYLGPEAIIFGIDINPDCLVSADPAVQVRIGSQADEEFLRSIIEEMGGVDVVVDDGSHIASHQILSFDVLFPLLSESGLYICEDLHTAYMPNFEGGLNRDGTFIEFTKKMMDWLHDWYVTPADRKRLRYSDPYGFATGVSGVCVYDSVVVVEKCRKDRPFHTIVGKNNLRQGHASPAPTRID